MGFQASIFNIFLGLEFLLSLNSGVIAKLPIAFLQLKRHKWMAWTYRNQKQLFLSSLPNVNVQRERDDFNFFIIIIIIILNLSAIALIGRMLKWCNKE